ncbi:MAG: hypothetical protein ABI895_21990 [Deltaproteobacteria bacterium]
MQPSAKLPTDLLRIGPTAFLLGVAVALILAYLVLQLVRHLARRRRIRRAGRAAHAERAAAQVLVRAGYAIVGRQVRRAWSVLADGEEVGFDLIADYLVESSGTLWVAEVKTGPQALSLRHGPTRRQLLEYRQAFGVEGVLLVDAEAEHVRRIQFREPPLEGRCRRALCWLVAGLLLGLALGHYGPGAAVLVR